MAVLGSLEKDSWVVFEQSKISDRSFERGAKVGVKKS
jgi:hypothetical protein